MSAMKFRPAFRNRLSGEIAISFVLHDMEDIPWKTWWPTGGPQTATEFQALVEEGFVDDQGKFYDRTSAALAAGLRPDQRLAEDFREAGVISYERVH